MEISLTPMEMTCAANTGVIRRVTSIQNKLNSGIYYSKEANLWQTDIEGACAELACAKALGIYWGAGVNTFKSADLGRKIQVRATAGRTNKLIIRDRDSDHDIFILVVGSAPNYDVVGWIYGAAGKDPRWLGDANNIGKPAYFIPQQSLNPIEELTAAVQKGVGA